MDAVRHGLKVLPAELQEHYHAEALDFIGQEATHRRLHSLFNATWTGKVWSTTGRRAPKET